MPEFYLKIELGNDDFYTSTGKFSEYRLADAINRVAGDVRSGDLTRGRVMDENGNTVGNWSFDWSD